MDELQAVPRARLLPKLAKGELAAEKWGGNGPVTRIICGYWVASVTQKACS